MPLDNQIAYIFYRLVIITDFHPYAFIPAIEITGINRLVLCIQRRKHLQRMYPHICHAVLYNLNIDTRLAVAVYLHPSNPLNVLQLPFHQPGIIQQFFIGNPVRRHGIKHPVHIPEIIHHHRRHSSGRQFRLGICHFPPQHVPFLFQLVRFHSTRQFNRNLGNIRHGLRLDVIDLPHRAYRLFQYVRHFQLHLMGGSARINRYHHRLLHFQLRIFELAHGDEGKHAANHQYGNKKLYQRPVIQSIFRDIHIL